MSPYFEFFVRKKITEKKVVCGSMFALSTKNWDVKSLYVNLKLFDKWVVCIVFLEGVHKTIDEISVTIGAVWICLKYCVQNPHCSTGC